MSLIFPFRAGHKSGFTLIELLVVITIIGVLATLMIANFSGARARARDSRRKSDLNQLKTALRLYYNDNQAYPPSSGGEMTCCGFGESFTVNGEEYMRMVPEDPLNTGPYVYEYEQTDSGDGFRLSSQLENASDEDAQSSQLRCGIAPQDVQPQVYLTCQD